MLHIFTHDDADGYASGYLVYKYFKTTNDLKENEYKYHFMNYNKEFPFNQIDKYDIVFITDFSINPEDMIKLHKITPYVIWIDHHISSIEKYKDWNDLVKENYFTHYNKNYNKNYNSEYIIDGLRMNGISGCALTWLYLYKGWTEEQKIQAFNEIGEQEVFNLMMKDFENAPLWIQLINDWDVWRLKLNDTKPFITALNNNLSIETIQQLDLDSQNNTDLHYLNKLIEDGRKFIDYRDNWAAQLRDKYGYKTELLLDKNKSYKVYCLNVGNANSDYSGNKILDKYDIVCHYCFNGNKYVYSMYSNKDYINCANLCKYFGKDNGGGHKGAAGFTSKDLIFKKDEPVLILNYNERED